MPEGMLTLCCVRDELLVTSRDGLMHFFSWENSETERILSIMDIPFAMDLQQSRGSSLDEVRAVKAKARQTLRTAPDRPILPVVPGDQTLKSATNHNVAYLEKRL